MVSQREQELEKYLPKYLLCLLYEDKKGSALTCNSVRGSSWSWAKGSEVEMGQLVSVGKC